MQEDPEEREMTENILKAIEREYGFVPVVNKILSERPDMFIPAASLGRAVLEGRGELDRKTRFLAAVSAAAALGGQHCVRVQMRHAEQAGATRDEILESILIGSYMAMTRSQSYALREYGEMFKDKE
ncbi:MAG: carboxymuconolactone decarboxylase family protein [Methanomassiliicoccaceae archaeon]|nr:carboxymuconolactone decarboxylase family protein [Methanomassiliicoccaceae archaeon]